MVGYNPAMMEYMERLDLDRDDAEGFDPFSLGFEFGFSVEGPQKQNFNSEESENSQISSLGQLDPKFGKFSASYV